MVNFRALSGLESERRIFMHVFEEISVAQGGDHNAPPSSQKNVFFP